MLKKEAVENKVTAMMNEEFKILLKALLHVCDIITLCSAHCARTVIYSGWTSKPTPRSEKVILSSIVSKGFSNGDVFRSAFSVMMFNAVAVKDKKALSMQLTTKVEFQSVVSVILRSALELCVHFRFYNFSSKLADNFSKVHNCFSDFSFG